MEPLSDESLVNGIQGGRNQFFGKVQDIDWVNVKIIEDLTPKDVN